MLSRRSDDVRTVLAARARLRSLREYGVAAEYFPGYRNLKLRPHSLDVVLVTFIVSGHGRHYMGDEVHEEGPGAVGVTHYGQEHDLLTDSDGMDVLNLYLDPQHHALPRVPEELRGALQSFLPIHPGFYHRCNRRVRFRFDEPGAPSALLHMIARETAALGPGSRVLMESLLLAFLTLACRQVMESGLAVAGGGADGGGAVERVRRMLDERSAEPHRLDAMAQMARLTRTAFCRAFKRYTGKAPFDYLHQRRIESAAFALRNSREKILVVAVESGFGDVSFFNRKFRAMMGCSPSRYRARWNRG